MITMIENIDDSPVVVAAVTTGKTTTTRKRAIVDLCPLLTDDNRLVGLVVRRPPRERKIPGSNPA